MPCDSYTLDNYLCFNKVLSDVSVSFTTHNVKYCIFGRGHEYLNRSSSRNVASLKFIIDESLCFCLHCGMSDIEYTYTNNVGGYSLIDHIIIISNNLMYSIISKCSLELVDCPIICPYNCTQQIILELHEYVVQCDDVLCA